MKASRFLCGYRTAPGEPRKCTRHARWMFGECDEHILALLARWRVPKSTISWFRARFREDPTEAQQA